MATQHRTEWILELMDKVTSPAKRVMTSMGNIDEAMGQTASNMAEFAEPGISQLRNLRQGFMDSARGVPVLGDAIQLLENPIGAALTAAVSLALVLGTMTGKAADFQQDLAELSAITGTVGEDLDYIGERSLSMAAQYGLATSQTVEASKLLASNIDIATIGGVRGLSMLQEQTVLLSKAAGVDMPLAANLMAGAINQFSLPASDAARVVNTLAAGAKFGAAEIPDLALSLKNAGTTAALAGVSLESTVAALELMSQNMIKGSEAGTGLRNVINVLQTKDIAGVDFATMGFAGSLQALAPRLEDATFLTEIFGRENLSSAQILIKNGSAMDEMTKKVTGTSVAMEQAQIQTNTWSGSMDRFRALWETASISIGSMIIDILFPALNMVNSTFQWMIDNGTAIKAVLIGVGIVAAGAAINWIVLNAATIGATIGLGLFNLAFMAMNAVLAVTPLGWILIAVGALAGAAYYAWNEFEEFRGVIVGTYEAVKVFGNFLYDSVIIRIKEILSGMKGLAGAIGAFFSGEFEQAAELGSQAIFDLQGTASDAKIGIMFDDSVADAISAGREGYMKGVGMGSEEAGASGSMNAPPFAPQDLNLDGSTPGGASIEQSKSGIEGGGSSKIITMTIGDINMEFNLPQNLQAGAEEAATLVAQILTGKIRNGLALGS
jgi:TP901 family phage tail tape measure protein